MSLETDIQRGHAAARLLEDPLLAECFAEVERGFINAMKAGGPLGGDDCMRLVIGLRASAKVREWLVGVHTGAALAAKEIEQR